MQINGGGGIRTPVPRCFKASVYMLSRFIVFFTLPGAKTTGSWLSYFGKVSLCRPEQPAQPACLVTPLPDPQAKSGRTGCQFRQPCATVCCRLKLVAGMISQANRRPGHAACPSIIRSKPFAPIFTFHKRAYFFDLVFLVFFRTTFFFTLFFAVDCTILKTGMVNEGNPIRAIIFCTNSRQYGQAL